MHVVRHRVRIVSVCIVCASSFNVTTSFTTSFTTLTLLPSLAASGRGAILRKEVHLRKRVVLSVAP
jgi:hypothetical protein